MTAKVVVWGCIAAHVVACIVVGYIYGPFWGVIGLCWPLLTELYLLVMAVTTGAVLPAVPAIAYILLPPLGLVAMQRRRLPRKAESTTPHHAFFHHR